MKVMSPRSTKGRKASCCALLKRCPSPTKRFVWRPDCASTASACATASRMSFTPASTAEMAMKSALKASAIRRASVVLPEPGGPHRIIECGLRELNATSSGFPGASRCRWPTISPGVFGRSRSASGVAGFATAKRSLADDICALGRSELEQIGTELRIAFEVEQTHQRVLPEIIGDRERGETARVESEANFQEGGFLVLGLGREPVEPVGGREILPVECVLDVFLAGEECGGKGGRRAGVAAGRAPASGRIA